MSEGTTAVVRSRLRTWIVLASVLCALLLVFFLVVLMWVKSEGDIRAVEAEVVAAGFAILPDPPVPTESQRLARARRADAAVMAIKIEWPGQSYNLRSAQSVSDEYRAVHQSISSQEVCAAARMIIALGNEPIRMPPGEKDLPLYKWRELFTSRLVIAEGEELDLCLTALQVFFEMFLRGGDQYSGGLNYLSDLSGHLARRVGDRREQLRPMADWLESLAQRCWEAQPRLAERDLQRSLTSFCDGEQAIRELGVSVHGWMQVPLFMQFAMRTERASLLRAKLEWLQFIKAHPDQPRVWLDEAARRQAALGKVGSWLGPSREWLLWSQHPDLLRRWMGAVLYARLIAAELRASPWPIDLYDRSGGQLRRWEKNGVLIGAYSVGPNGVDDGGGSPSDLNLRLRPDPVAPTP